MARKFESDEERTFVQAIIEKPDDDTPRLAYADWLQEHERPEEAGMIQRQVGLGNWQIAPYAFKKEEQAFLERYGQKLAKEVDISSGRPQRKHPDLPAHIDDYQMCRGFIDTVTIDENSLDAGWGGMEKRHPLRDISVNSATGLSDPEKLAAFMQDLPATVRALNITLSPRGAQGLWNAPNVKQLSDLSVHIDCAGTRQRGSALSSGLVKVTRDLAGCAGLGNLTQLTVGYIQNFELRPEHQRQIAEAIVNSQHLQGLQELGVDEEIVPHVLHVLRHEAKGKLPHLQYLNDRSLSEYPEEITTTRHGRRGGGQGGGQSAGGR